MIPNPQLPMTYQILGKSALNISRIGFGCMSLQPGQQNMQAIIDKAVDSGINYFDTADLYHKGINETDIGRGLAKKRSKVIIATKVGNQWRADGSGWNWNAGKKYILEAADQSLTRLQTTYIDLYQLHGGTMDDPIDDVIEAFELLQQQGKIRYYGISSIRPNVIREYVRRSNITSVMMQYSLADRRPEETCLGLLKDNSIGVLARGSIAGGLLAGKPSKTYLGYCEKEIISAAAATRAVTLPGSNPAATAIRFALQHPAITSAVVGIRTEEHLADALQALRGGPFLQEELPFLTGSLPINKYEQHR